MAENTVTVKKECSETSPLFRAQRWGIPKEAIDDLADRLRRLWSRFRKHFKTKTRNTSEYAFVYLRGLLTLDTKRNYTGIARRVIDPQNDGQNLQQNLQQFMSDSPWSAKSVFQQIRYEIGKRPELTGGMLTLDESGDKRSGDQSAGSARQRIGRLGKVDMGQVGVALGYYQNGIWTMVDAQLYLPETWFDDEVARFFWTQNGQP